MKKLSLIISLCFISIMGLKAATIESGEFNEMNSKWEFDFETGTLTISVLDPTNENFNFDGNVVGAIPNFELNEEEETGMAPWYKTFGEDITSIVIEEGIIRIGDRAFSQCYYVQSISLPEGLQEIGEYAFMQLSDLTEIVIPEGVTKLGKYAFAQCSGLQTIQLPSTITKISQYCFGACESLNEVYCYATEVPASYSNSFIEVDCSSVDLYVPEESFENYNNDPDWAAFSIKVIGEEEPVDDGTCKLQSTGDMDFVRSDMMESADEEGTYIFYLYTNSAWTLENVNSAYSQPGNGEMFEITIRPEAPTNMAGTYENGFEVFQTVKNGSTIDYYYRTEGSLIITLSESGNAYDFVYNLTMENSSDDTDTRTLQGTVIGVCSNIEIAQGLFDVRSDNAAAKKQIRNGVLLIEAGGKTYNAQGVEVK